MQIMIDINEALESTRRAQAAIAMLKSALAVLEGISIVQEPVAPVVSAADDMPSDAVDTLPQPPKFGDALPVFGPIHVQPTDKPPIAGDDDPEIDTDDVPAPVVSLAATVLVPAAPIAPTGPSIAPPPPTPAPPGPAVAPELDSRGMPWDSRIHAANRSKTIKGEWKAKRGVDPNLVTAVEAQNGAPSVLPVTGAIMPDPTPAAPAPTAAPPPPAAPSAVIAPVPPSTAVAPTSAPVSTAATATTPPVSIASAIDFRGLMIKIGTASAAGKLTHEQINGALGTVGLKLEDMGKLAGNALLIASVNAAIDACLA